LKLLLRFLFVSLQCIPYGIATVDNEIQLWRNSLRMLKSFCHSSFRDVALLYMDISEVCKTNTFLFGIVAFCL